MSLNDHKVIDGITLDASLLALAEVAVRGSGDGRISKEDAEKLLDAILNDGLYTDVERDTVRFILKNFRWTSAASDWFALQLEEWQKREAKFVSMTPETLLKELFSKVDVLKEETDRTKREADLRTATMETYDNHDDIGLIVRLADGRRIEVKSNFIELQGEFVELRGGLAIPVRAIEKVEI